jgi:hypothetical protein
VAFADGLGGENITTGHDIWVFLVEVDLYLSSYPNILIC